MCLRLYLLMYICDKHISHITFLLFIHHWLTFDLFLFAVNNTIISNLGTNIFLRCRFQFFWFCRLKGLKWSCWTVWQFWFQFWTEEVKFLGCMAVLVWVLGWRSEISGLYGSSGSGFVLKWNCWTVWQFWFGFWETLHTVFHSGCHSISSTRCLTESSTL